MLLQLQQPGANPGGAPNWGALTNPAFSQATVDFALNRAYERLMMDLADLELYSQVMTITSTANGYQYGIPTSGFPKIHLVQRVFYAPQGLSYTLEFIPGVRLVDWRKFQVYTAGGYLQPFAFGVQPDFAAINPTRTQLCFYPGSANSGDTITVNYAPIPTAGTSVPLLVNETDTPVLPADTHEALTYAALAFLWIKARELDASAMFRKLYADEVQRIRDLYYRSSAGSSMQLSDSSFMLAMTYPFGPVF